MNLQNNKEIKDLDKTRIKIKISDVRDKDGKSYDIHKKELIEDCFQKISRIKNTNTYELYCNLYYEKNEFKKFNDEIGKYNILPYDFLSDLLIGYTIDFVVELYTENFEDVLLKVSYNNCKIEKIDGFCDHWFKLENVFNFKFEPAQLVVDFHCDNITFYKDKTPSFLKNKS